MCKGHFKLQEKSLTQFVKVCVYSITARHGANESSLQEGGPLIYQTPVTPEVILLDRSHVDVQQGDLFF